MSKSREDTEQEKVVTYCDLRQITIFHPANGGKRNASEAAHLKRLGVKAGVPDLVIPVARGGYHGLFIEMKVKPNKPTENQKQWIELLNNNGYLAVVCYGFEEAKKVIDEYMEGKHGRYG